MSVFRVNTVNSYCDQFVWSELREAYSEEKLTK